MPQKINFVSAKDADLEPIIALLADDDLGAQRERYQHPLPETYTTAFEIIGDDPYAELIVAKIEDHIVGVAQINFITNLTYQGGTRAQIEGVRIHKDYRSQGIGQKLFEYLIELAKQRACHMVQLTSNQSRSKACDFYRQLGFVDSHVGFKLFLT